MESTTFVWYAIAMATEGKFLSFKKCRSQGTKVRTKWGEKRRTNELWVVKCGIIIICGFLIYFIIKLCRYRAYFKWNHIKKCVQSQCDWLQCDLLCSMRNALECKIVKWKLPNSSVEAIILFITSIKWNYLYPHVIPMELVLLFLKFLHKQMLARSRIHQSKVTNYSNRNGTHT